tara:strand:+ start:156 stop:629 length:474 start_codon:yes stop_codon:yes gene_type:complete
MFNKKPKTIEYTYDDFNEGITSIVNNINAVGTQYNKIVGLVRGGMPLATRLSYILEIPLVPLTWSTRDFEDKEINETIPDDLNAGQKILLVDDLLDTGETVRQVLETFGDYPKENISIACLYLNTDQETMPDFFHKTISRSEDERWIDFWWENKDVL